MAVRRVMVVWIHPLFRVSLRAVLNHSQIEWVGDCNRPDELPALLALKKPEIVIIEEEPGAAENQAMRILQFYQSNIRLISLNLNGNEGQLYQIEQETINQQEDLINLILKE